MVIELFKNFPHAPGLFGLYGLSGLSGFYGLYRYLIFEERPASPPSYKNRGYAG